jgi:zinc D-Ala-D-Ala carboxypeptidase
MSAAIWTQYPNFSRSEFLCKHTGRDGMQHEFMQVLQAIRTEYGRPMRVTSGYRHPTHPVEARKQRSDGEHTRGMCADIAVADGRERFELVRLALKHGITRIGIARGFIHLGLGGPGLPPNVIWEYQ